MAVSKRVSVVPMRDNERVWVQEYLQPVAMSDLSQVDVWVIKWWVDSNYPEGVIECYVGIGESTSEDEGFMLGTPGECVTDAVYESVVERIRSEGFPIRNYDEDYAG